MNKSIKILINYFLGPILFILLCFSLYKQLMHQNDLENRLQQIKNCWKNGQVIFIFFLMVLNWSIEAKKWQLLVSHIQQLKFIAALKSVLSGCSVTMLTPNRIGEYGGRILYLQEQNRIKGISLTIVGSISQLLITMVVGSIGLIYLRFFSHTNNKVLNDLPHFWGDLLIYFSLLGAIIIFLFYIRIGWLVRLLEKARGFNKIIKHIAILEEFNNNSLITILSLSLVRYLIFVLQYILLLHVMQVAIAPVLSFWLITIFYLIMAIAPTIGLLELPLRAKISVELFGFCNNTLGVGSAALGIWIINLVIPALIGSLLILGIKIVKEK